ncbi:MAG: acetylglutamate kinase [Chthoniobacterales bacterium]
MDELISKAATLLEALPYIQRFRNEVFVVKYGGSFMDSPSEEERDRVAGDIVFLETVGINPVVVHGGGKAITRALERAGVQTRFVDGQRVTDASTVEVVERVLSHEINPEIVSAIAKLGGKAQGFSGTEIFRCRRFASKDLGFVGEVYEVEAAALRDCIRRGITPVVSPTARGDDGEIYNCNADIAAAQCAIALKARRLVYMSDVAGLLGNPADPQTLISHLRIEEVPELKERGVVDRGMVPKVDSAIRAIESGVEKVQFVDGRVPHSILLEIFTDAGVGTEVVV